MIALDATLLALTFALAIDAAVGYPDAVFRRIGHPVTWIGALISWLDATLNRPDMSFTARRAAGVVALIVIIAVPVLIVAAVTSALPSDVVGIIAVGIMASTLIAARSLFDHVRDCADALENHGLDGGRAAVAKIVGRDPLALDEHGVSRAAIESLAENASDGVVAPVLWFALLGLPGLVAYKAINTADSMIGHRSPKHEAFGWAAARLDDLVNLPASRLTGALFTLAAKFMPGASPRQALRAMRRDASRHRSPNAGWPESAMAGALGLQLAGPRKYAGVMVDDATMGDGNRNATAADIRRALRLAVVAWGIMFLVSVVAAAIA